MVAALALAVLLLFATNILAKSGLPDGEWYAPILLAAPEAIGPLLGVAIGGLLTVLAQRESHKRDLAARRRQVAGAFLGEISGVVKLIELRRYLPLLESLVDQARIAQTATFPIVPIRRAYDRIYQSNADKLGTLPPDVAEKIGRFYTAMNALLEDANYWASDLNGERYPASDVIEPLEETAKLLAGLVSLGAELVPQLKVIAHEGPPRRK